MDPSFLSRDDSNTFLVVIHVSNQTRPRQDTDMYVYTDFLSYFLNHIGKYRNDPKFSDRQVWVNSADSEHHAPRGAV